MAPSGSCSDLAAAPGLHAKPAGFGSNSLRISQSALRSRYSHGDAAGRSHQRVVKVFGCITVKRFVASPAANARAGLW